MNAKYQLPNYAAAGGDGATYKSQLDGNAKVLARIGAAYQAYASDTPDWYAHLAAGALVAAGTVVENAIQTTGAFAAPVTNPRIDRIVIDQATGVVSVLTGTEAGSPTAPALTSGKLPVARVALTTSSTCITNSMITDERATPTTVSSGQVAAPAGENIADRDAIYLDTFNQRGGGATKWYKIDTDATGPVKISPIVGIAIGAITSGNTGVAQVGPGEVTGFSGLTAGQAVYASATAGAVTQTAPAIPSTGTQNATRLLGYATGTTSIMFHPDARTTFTYRNSALASAGSVTVEHFTDSGGRERELFAALVAGGNASILQGAGSTIGNATSGGGLAAAFDGNASQGYAASAQASATACYIGKDWGSGVTKTVTQAIVDSTTDNDFTNSFNSGTNTLVLQGSTDNFSSSIVDLGTFTTGADNTSRVTATITASDVSTAYRYHRIKLTNSNGGSQNYCVAEVVFYEAGLDEPIMVSSELISSAATDRMTAKMSDSAGANGNTKTTFYNRTNATRDLVAQVVV